MREKGRMRVSTREKMTKTKVKVTRELLRGGSLGSSRDGHTCPFILPAIWTVNDFKPTMTTNIFKNLRHRYQIPDNIPTCLLRKFEKCYSRKTVDIDMYNAMFTAGLRLLLMELHH